MSNHHRPYVLAEATWKSVKEIAYQVAILPWGATEAHNYHLPYATDLVHAEWVAVDAARRAWDRGAKVVVLPGVPFGVNTSQLDIPLTINMNPSTQLALLGDVAAALAQQGIPKLVIVNGHGGNDFRQIVRELQPRHPGLFLACVNWYQVLNPDTYFRPGDHAGEMETSVMLHIAPELVLPLSDAGSGEAREFTIRALRERWAWAPRAWTRVTRDTGIGNPRGASAEKGKAYLDAVAAAVGEFLVDLAATDPGALYE